MRSLANRVVVITGAASGIGRATALAFARAGARVHVADIDEDGVRAVAAEARAAGAHRVDCRSAEAVGELAARVYAAEGRVHVLHNNAGIIHAAAIDDTSLDDWRRVIDVNLWGVVHGIHAFVPRMLAQGEPAHIVNTASGLGLIAWPGFAPYCASKFAVVGLSEALAAELAPRGIAVTVVCPGVTATNLVRNARVGARVAHRRRAIERVVDRFGASPDDIAAAVLRAVRRRGPVVQVAPSWQVVPVWWLKRLSMPTYQRAARQLNRLLATTAA
jgi:NAD(P)-dependent dehydrogenase (short-subunit alcohol dehydrogenase family)